MQQLHPLANGHVLGVPPLSGERNRSSVAKCLAVSRIARKGGRAAHTEVVDRLAFYFAQRAPERHSSMRTSVSSG